MCYNKTLVVSPSDVTVTSKKYVYSLLLLLAKKELLCDTRTPSQSTFHLFYLFTFFKISRNKKNPKDCSSKVRENSKIFLSWISIKSCGRHGISTKSPRSAKISLK